MASDPHEYLGDGVGSAKKPHACVLVIFGASGDLTKRKLIPALYNLALEKRLPERFAVVGYARSEMTDESFRDKMREATKEFSRTGLKDDVWQQFANTLYYVRGGYEDHDGFQKLKEFVEGFDRGSRVLPARVFYLATPPDAYEKLIECIASKGLAPKETDGEPRARVVIEKPFGTDLQTARELNRRILIISAKKPCRTSWFSVSPTRCSSRSGTGATSITCKLPRRNPWAWKLAAVITSKLA